MEKSTEIMADRHESVALGPSRREPSISTALETDSAKNSNEDKTDDRATTKNKKSKKSVPLYKLFMFADAIDILLMVIGTAGAIVAGLGLPAMTVLFGSLIDAFGNTSATNLNSLVHRVLEVGVLFVYLGIATGVGSFCEASCWTWSGERQAARLRSLYLETILRQDITFFDTETSTGEVVSTLSADTATIQEAMREKVGTFIQLTTSFLGGLIVAMVRGWKLALVMLATVPLIICVGAFIAMVVTKASGRSQKAFAEAGNIVEQTIGAICTVVSFGREKKAISDYNRSLKLAYKTTIQIGIAGGLGLGVFLFVMYCSYALALWYGSRLIINEGYSGGKVITVIFAVLTGGIAFSQATPSIDAFAKGQAAAYKMFEAFKRIPKIDAYDTNGIILKEIAGDIEFKDVYFSYPSRPDVQIFSGFSLSVRRGTKTAIVGESGSGKSTIISLIERFYDPTSGEVLIDGTNLKKFQLKSIREKIGLVSQEPVLFATTIKENIAYGKAEATPEEIETAAEIANAANFIRKMPQGFETLVGEHGSQLSGGQKQRVAIARAIIKDPKILSLDEATSALDTVSERKVQKALDRIMMNRTVVIVAHRRTSVRNADATVVVQKGTNVEKGTHSQLMMNPLGAYFKLISLQETKESKEMEESKQHLNNDTENLEIDEDEIGLNSDQNAGRPLLIESIGSRSSSVSGEQCHDDLEGNVDINDISQEKQNRFGLLACFQKFESKKDIEEGRTNIPRNIPFLRLARLNRPEVPVLVLGSVAAAFVGLSFPLFGLLFSSVISSFFVASHKLRKEVNFWSLMFVILATVMLLMAPIQKLCFAIAGGKLVQRIRSITFEKVIYQEIEWFDDQQNSSGAIIARLSTDAAIARAVVGDALSLVAQNIATIGAGIIISFSASWKLSLLLIALIPFFGLHGWIQMKFLKGFSADAKMKYEQASQLANEAVGSIRTVASFCAEKVVLSLYKEKCRGPLKKGTQAGLVTGIGLGIANFAMYSSYALIFWVGSRMVKSGETTFSDVFKVFFALTMTAVGTSKSMGMAPDLGKVQTSVNSMFNILERKSKIDASDISGDMLDNLKGEIQFCNVHFRYPTRKDILILRGLNISFSSGKTTALVGESGSGKSTVIALLQRFYDPDSGHILLDGFEIGKLKIKWFRQQMGLVSQEPVLFNETIRENIGYGEEGLVTEEQIREAAEASNAHKFISSLTEGYDTLVGERGIQLSGGQKQRIAIARAILRNPKILLLDEATSALDAESERLVQDALDYVKLNRTTIVIAHRLSTIRDADLIAVVKNGVITEQGKHDELLAINDGAYATLVGLHMVSS